MCSQGALPFTVSTKMFLPDDRRNRHVIPRWRDSRTTAALGELDSLGQPKAKELLSDPRVSTGVLIARKVTDWSTHRSVSFASDLLATAMSVGAEHPSASDAANFLIGTEAASPAAKAIARRFLGHSGPVGDVLERYSGARSNLTRDLRYLRIHALKERLRDSPRNLLARVDLALEYIALGMAPQALAAMDIAVRLAPNDRFLLRAASRLLVHIGDEETALAILRQSDRSKYDPWLTAAEIAIAGRANKATRLAKIGSQMLSANQFSSFHTTELASALGTLEAESGARKKAARLFRRSLVDPTENVIAQAEWASQRMGFDEFQASWLDFPGSFEARARNDSQTGHFVEAVEETWKWLHDQAFSHTAATFGSYLASVALEDHEQALRFVEAGQTANPHGWLLANNRVFALANLGRLEEAESMWQTIPKNAAEGDRTATLLATKGLLLFKRGFTAAGREFYVTAIDWFVKAGYPKAAALAAIFHAREELSTGDDDSSEAAVQRARALSKDIVSPEIIAAVARLEELLSARRVASSARG
jgi:tetratricopeptide (TPR) repeat protein